MRAKSLNDKAIFATTDLKGSCQITFTTRTIDPQENFSFFHSEFQKFWENVFYRYFWLSKQ